MFGRKKNDENACDIKDFSMSDVGGVPEDHKFFRCLNCRHVWHAKLQTSCPLCGCREVTQCSEFLYDAYIEKQKTSR